MWKKFNGDIQILVNRLVLQLNFYYIQWDQWKLQVELTSKAGPVGKKLVINSYIFNLNECVSY